MAVQMAVRNVDLIELIQSERFISLQQTLGKIYLEPVILRVEAQDLVPVPPEKTGLVHNIAGTCRMLP